MAALRSLKPALKATRKLRGLPAGDWIGHSKSAAASKIAASLRHLVSRTTYGYSPADLATAEALGHEGWLDLQLNGAGLDDTVLESAVNDALISLQWNYQEVLENEQLDNSDPDKINVAVELIVATMVRQLFSPFQLRELMVEFWSNHFNVYLLDGPVSFLKTVDDRENVRPHALGNFRDLLMANARSPAMLYYLDNYSNTVDGPNENYARELLELHTMGVDGGYTEFDVKEVARCFTGWTINPRAEDLFAFYPQTHDDGPKDVLGVRIPAGQGIEDGEQVLDILASHPATARYVSTKLARRFVSDDPQESLVDNLAATFTATDGDIKAVLNALFASEEFAESSGMKFKRPGEMLISAVKATSSQPTDDYLVVLIGFLETLEQLPFFASPPTGYDDVESAWLATSSLLNRWNFTSALAFGNLPVPLTRRAEGQGGNPPMSRFFNVNMDFLLDGARSPQDIVDTLVDAILPAGVSDAESDALLLLAGNKQDPQRPMTAAQARYGGRAVLATLLASPAFQRR